MLRAEIVHLLIAAPFQQVTLAVLPLATLAGAIRNLRAHFGDQVFLLHNRTRWMMAVAAIDATMTMVLSALCFRYWGLAGAAGATVWPRWPPRSSAFDRVFRFGLRTSRRASDPHRTGNIAMAALLGSFRKRATLAVWLPISGPAPQLYLATLAVLYAPTLFKILRSRPQHSEAMRRERDRARLGD